MVSLTFTAVAISGRAYAVEIAPAVVQYDDAVRTEGKRVARVAGIQNAFDDERSLPLDADPLQVLPRDGRVDAGSDPAEVILEPGDFTAVRRNIAEIVGPAEQADVLIPARCR